jgi:hypothetical protein
MILMSIANGIAIEFQLVIPYLALSLFMFLAALSITVRRLHDTGRSVWWFLLLVPVIGAIVLIFFLVEDGEDDNEYGVILGLQRQNKAYITFIITSLIHQYKNIICILSANFKACNNKLF